MNQPVCPDRSEACVRLPTRAGLVSQKEGPSEKTHLERKAGPDRLESRKGGSPGPSQTTPPLGLRAHRNPAEANSFQSHFNQAREEELCPVTQKLWVSSVITGPAGPHVSAPTDVPSQVRSVFASPGAPGAPGASLPQDRRSPALSADRQVSEPSCAAIDGCG